MWYCNQKGIVHRDLKLENMLFDAKMNIKIANFGLINEFISHNVNTYCGNLTFCHPRTLPGPTLQWAPQWICRALGVVLFYSHWIPCGEDFSGSCDNFLFFSSFECENLLKKLIDNSQCQQQRSFRGNNEGSMDKYMPRGQTQTS